MGELVQRDVWASKDAVRLSRSTTFLCAYAWSWGKQVGVTPHSTAHPGGGASFGAKRNHALTPIRPSSNPSVLPPLDGAAVLALSPHARPDCKQVARKFGPKRPQIAS